LTGAVIGFPEVGRTIIEAAPGTPKNMRSDRYMSKGEEFARGHGLVSDASASSALVARATKILADRFGVSRPSVALVLGSGLGGFAKRIERPTRVAFSEIAGFSMPSVEGHAGEVVHGTVGGREVVALSGRFHSYEAHSAAVVALPIRLVHALGASVLFLSNAAGAIRAGFEPGTLMILRDHINMSWRNPLIGRAGPNEARFPDMSAPYDAPLSAAFQSAAAAASLSVVNGVYASVLGPSYETAAEVRMLERAGADAVGMSTVAEVLVARALGMRVVAASCLTNFAAGRSARPLAHAEVLTAAARIAPAFERAVVDWIGGL
jgi:purine-nucleoside phosphorylase